MIKRIVVAEITAITILSACSASQTGTPIPTAQVINIYYSPSLDYSRNDISRCIKSSNTVVPYLHEQSTEISNLQSGDILLHLGEADWDENDFFVTRITYENIMFIVNTSNPLESIDINELEAIFSGRQKYWQMESMNGALISVWAYPKDSELSNWINSGLLGGGRSGINFKLVPDPESALEAVSQDEFGISYVPGGWIEQIDNRKLSSVKVLKIQNSDDVLTPLPVLAYLSKKPSGVIRDFLLCLREIQ